MIKILSLYSAVIICFFSSVLLFTYSWKKNHSKNILGIFMLILFVFFTTVAVYQLKNFSIYSYLDGLSAFTMLLINPFYYFYVRSLSKNIRLSSKDLLHVIPAFLLFCLISIAYVNISNETEMVYLRNMLLHNYSGFSGWASFLASLRTVRESIYVLQAIAYFALSIMILIKHKKNINNLFSSDEGVSLYWVRILNAILIIGIVMSVTLNIMGLDNIESNSTFLIISMFTFAAIFGAFTIFGLKQKKIFDDTDDALNNRDIVDENTFNYDLLEEKLMMFFNDRKPYLNPDLKIWDLSKELNTNRTYLSKFFNEKLDMNFSDFVNKFRVEKAKDVINNSNLCNEKIAYESGFNSLTSFYRAFKKAEKITPAEYRKIKT